VAEEQAPMRPIGWWLKTADARLDAAIDRSLRGQDVDRRQWQVLASLARRPMSGADLAAALAPFDPPAIVEGVAAALVARGWVDESEGLLRLTGEGEQAHGRLAPLVDEVRGQVAAALPADDYRLLVQLLARLVAGLDPD